MSFQQEDEGYAMLMIMFVTKPGNDCAAVMRAETRSLVRCRQTRALALK